MTTCKIIDTLTLYEEMQRLTDSKSKQDYFRYQMMKPFEKMWQLLNVPLTAKQENGYDVIMATKMLGWLDVDDDLAIQAVLPIFKKHKIYEVVENALKICMEHAKNAGLIINTDEIIGGLFIADPEELALSNGYSGFGGIPGFIALAVYPNDYNLPRIPALITHEFHHNIRFSYFEWNHGNVTVGDYLVIEGLAESFAKEICGEEQLGPWVCHMDKDDLEYSLYVIGEALEVKGFAQVSSYMFGDEIAKKQGFQPVGLSYCAGYAVGYEVVQAFLKNSNKNIYEATLCSTSEIIKGSGLFPN